MARFSASSARRAFLPSFSRGMNLGMVSPPLLFLAVLHHDIGKIRGEGGVFVLRERAGAGHDHEGVPAVFRAVGRVDVRVGVGGETGARVEHLAAAGDGVHGRVDFEDDGLAGFGEEAERRRAQTLMR